VKIRLSRAHHPVTVLGPGRRIGLWTQGCGIGCEGCVARDTWAPDPATEVEIDRILAWCAGREPFDQPEALDALLARLDEWRRAHVGPIDFLCYSGRSLTALRARYGHILARLDAVIPGPFIADQAPGLRWRGSANQLLVPLSPLGHERYDAEIDRPAERSRFQVEVDGDTVYQIGVPLPGDLAALEAAMARRGVGYREASWWS
jgi:anaerobic ribonucleoside-triphosphate reductase activating protein